MGIKCIDTIFRKWGHLAGKRPWLLIISSVVLTVALGYGWTKRVAENRPEKQWVPAGSKALLHQEYVQDTWPSDLGVNNYISTCVKPEGCNMLNRTYLGTLFSKHIDFHGIKIDGSALAEAEKDNYHNDKPENDVSKYDGHWVFDKNFYTGKGEVKSKCYESGDRCFSNTVFASIFNGNDYDRCGDVIDEEKCDDKEREGCKWNSSDEVCESDCGKKKNEDDCKDFRKYCHWRHKTEKCEEHPEAAIPSNPNYFVNLEKQDILDMVNEYEDKPEPEFGRKMNVEDILGGITRNSVKKKSGEFEIIGATHIMSTYFMANMFVVDKSNNRKELLNAKFEFDGLCQLGIDIDNSDDGKCGPKLHPLDDFVEFYPFFQRSLSDEFGPAIQGDIAGLGASMMLIIVYLVVMLGKRDSVHAMAGLSLCALLVVGFSGIAGLGFGYMIGVNDNNLVTILWFLLIGLGVDDAFVLVNEFNRAESTNPDAPLELKTAAAGESAGTSILLTSFTDALAFLIGASTLLPALRGFCIFAGVSVLLCLFYNMNFLLPCIAINSRRAKANRFDCFCCFKAAEEHSFKDPKGCCFCLPGKPPVLENLFKWYAPKLSLWPVRIAVMLVFGAMLVVGVLGIFQLEQGFKIEWFLPDDSYVNQFITINEDVFKQGTTVTFFVPQSAKIDYHKDQEKIRNFCKWIKEHPDLIDDNDECWATEFHEWLEDSDNREYKTRSKENERQYYLVLNKWLNKGFYKDIKIEWEIEIPGGPMGQKIKKKMSRTETILTPAFGGRFSSNVMWISEKRPELGIAETRYSGKLKAERTIKALDRYNVMTKLRNDADGQITDSFPYSFDFLWWEESGIMGAELQRNLIICFATIFVVIVGLIWDIRTAIFVIFGLGFSIVELCGFAYYYGITINGVSTIYILLCVGLAVDYSAHVGHMFRISTGTASERAEKALIRIGPSVFNAVISTLLAVVMLSTSKSFIFRTFFRILLLVNIIAGAHGLIWLPCILGILGGSNIPKDTGSCTEIPVKADKNGTKDIEPAHILTISDGSNDG